MAKAKTAPLAGMRVLVTRPRARAAALSARIEMHGGEAVAFPVIDIGPPDERALNAALQHLDDIALLVFVSAHAVEFVADYLTRHRRHIPPTTRVAALGPQTAARCQQAAITVDYAARERIDSEGLLAELRAFEVADKDILICRAQSGREALKRGLQARGARVRYVESYRRQAANPPPLKWNENPIDAILISSPAVLDALIQSLGPRHRHLLDTTPIFTYGERVATYCRQAGIGGEIVASKQPSDESVVEAMLAWRRDV